MKILIPISKGFLKDGTYRKKGDHSFLWERKRDKITESKTSTPTPNSAK